MKKYSKKLTAFCFCMVIAKLNAFEWNVSSNVNVQTGNAASFVERWVTEQGRFWDEQDWRAGDFNGDGIDDLARVFRDGRDVSIDLYYSDKKVFVFGNWFLQQGRFRDNQNWRAGDFNGDGMDDIARAFKDNRNVSIDVYLRKN